MVTPTGIAQSARDAYGTLPLSFGPPGGARSSTTDSAGSTSERSLWDGVEAQARPCEDSAHVRIGRDSWDVSVRRRINRPGSPLLCRRCHERNG